MNSDHPSSSSPPQQWQRMFRNNPQDLGRAIGDAMAFLKGHGLGPQATYAANLIIEEIGTNILKYAYRDAAEHVIALRVSPQNRGVTIVFEDDGREFNPLEAPAPDLDAPIETRQTGGVGITLVRQFAAGLRYDRIGSINRLTALVARD